MRLCQNANEGMLAYLKKEKVALESGVIERERGSHCSHLAAERGNLAVLRHLPRETMNSQNQEGETPLHCLLKRAPRAVTQGI